VQCYAGFQKVLEFGAIWIHILRLGTLNLYIWIQEEKEEKEQT
jgi:hypothetical protein